MVLCWFSEVEYLETMEKCSGIFLLSALELAGGNLLDSGTRKESNPSQPILPSKVALIIKTMIKNIFYKIIYNLRRIVECRASILKWHARFTREHFKVAWQIHKGTHYSGMPDSQGNILKWHARFTSEHFKVACQIHKGTL